MLAEGDSVVVALRDVEPGERLRLATAETITASTFVPAGHKIAAVSLPAHAGVLKYGVEIGRTTQAVAAGAHVHTHNLESGRMRGDR